ncbi:juvenile hormone acid O-methyltransferase-like [Athalia rosae]|uniref:juvenile hormone acid O-methyltransferase-like n=1 Tax=Athalia rosae TaxID=37344 RepID=UPI002033CEB3|nr:juvenile hormone acid O-methyltransferase-like [Athalia rosae]XP_048514783.1 juvenile hormone acid O-methyltransferase-like [Athalia rosae]
MDQPLSYTKVNAKQHEVTENIVSEFEEELGEISGLCLDVGCGPGDVFVECVLPKFNSRAQAVCTDISEAMIKFCREKYGDNERLSFEKLDIQTKNLPERFVGRFDYVSSFYCLHWCWDLRKAFENIYDSLCPGGTSLVTFIANLPILDTYPGLAALPLYHPYMKDCDHFIPVFQNVNQPHKKLKTMLKDIGFDVQHCSVRETSTFYRNVDSLKTFLMAVNPFTSRLPPEVRVNYENQLLTEVLKRLIKEKNKDDYKILSTYTLFVVYLKKPQ